jgi:hypothetical protein
LDCLDSRGKVFLPDFDLLFKVTELRGQTSIIFTMCSNSFIVLNYWADLHQILSCIHLIRIHHILPGFLILPTFQCHRGKTLKSLRYINVFAHYRSQVCDLTYFSRLQTACPQPWPRYELLKTCNVTQFFSCSPYPTCRGHSSPITAFTVCTIRGGPT